MGIRDRQGQAPVAIFLRYPLQPRPRGLGHPDLRHIGHRRIGDQLHVALPFNLRLPAPTGYPA